MSMVLRFLLTAILAVSLSGIVSGADPTPAEVFEKRILPIFKSPDPSSCVECHLAGVDLKDYILPDPAKTFQSLRDQGLIDLENPERSKIVRLIEMGTESKGKPTIHARVRLAEKEAFLEWIKSCAADAGLKSTPRLDEKELAKPARPNEIIRHARKDRVLESFEKNVWAWRFRCMNCHTEGTLQNDKFRKEFGERVAWVKKAGSQASMEYLIKSKLIDIDQPDQSLLLLKPLGEDHKGGLKFVMGDQAYKGFRNWIEDVATIRNNKYVKSTDLPPPGSAMEGFGTDLWFKLENCPPEWGDKLLQVRIFDWNDQEKSWGQNPIATSDRVVFGKGKLWQHNLTLLAARGSDQAKAWRKGTPSLSPGKYLVRVYVDQTGKLAKDWKNEMADSDLVGQTEFEARWREGYGPMTIVNANRIRK